MIQPNPQSATLSPEGAKHTPGPIDVGGTVQQCTIGNFRVIVPRGWGAPTAYVASLADAHLYAAAPDLLDALKVAVIALQFQNPNSREVQMGLAALAKAERGQ